MAHLCSDFSWYIDFQRSMLNVESNRGKAKVTDVKFEHFSLNSLQKHDSTHQYKWFGNPNQKQFNFKSPGRKYFVASSILMHFDVWHHQMSFEKFLMLPIGTLSFLFLCQPMGSIKRHIMPPTHFSVTKPLQAILTGKQCNSCESISRKKNVYYTSWELNLNEHILPIKIISEDLFLGTYNIRTLSKTTTWKAYFVRLNHR